MPLHGGVTEWGVYQFADRWAPSGHPQLSLPPHSAYSYAQTRQGEGGEYLVRERVRTADEQMTLTTG